MFKLFISVIGYSPLKVSTLENKYGYLPKIIENEYGYLLKIIDSCYNIHYFHENNWEGTLVFKF